MNALSFLDRARANAATLDMLGAAPPPVPLALFDELPIQRRTSRDTRDWLAAYRQLEAEATLAAAMVQAACERYKAERSPANQASYVTADHAYDAARLRFQLQGAEIVRGVRAIAGIARELQLAHASSGRML